MKLYKAAPVFSTEDRKIIKGVEGDGNGGRIVRVLGVPFGGPKFLQGRDLDGEYFSPDTDIGPLKEAISYFDHNMHSDVDFGEIGVAKRVGKTDEGWLYDVIIDERNRYLDMIERLIEEDAVGASSGALPWGVRFARNGFIRNWPVIEMSLTHHPANPLAGVVEVRKSMTDKENPVNDENVEEPVIEEPVEEPVTEEEEQPTLRDQVEEILGEGDEEESLVDMIRSIAQRIEAIESTLKSVAQDSKTNAKDLAEVRDAVPKMAERIADFVGKRASKQQTLNSLSDREREALAVANTRQPQQTQRKSILPPDAPGVN